MQSAVIDAKHNNPPSDAEIMRDRLKERHAALLDEAENLLLEAEALPKEIFDDREASQINDFIKSLNDVTKRIESVRKAEKQPYLDAGRYVDGFFTIKTDELSAAVVRAKLPLTAHLQRKADEEAKRRAAEAERLRKEAEEKAAAAVKLEAEELAPQANAALNDAVKAEKQADALEQSIATGKGLAESKGYLGSGTLRKRWVGEIVDRNALNMALLGPHIPLDALQKALNSFVAAGGRELAGANIYQKEEVVVR